MVSLVCPNQVHSRFVNDAFIIARRLEGETKVTITLSDAFEISTGHPLRQELWWSLWGGKVMSVPPCYTFHARKMKKNTHFGDGFI